MTDILITQCPHCQTSLKLKRSQLKAAQGSVRCGICSQVFNTDNSISDRAIETQNTENLPTIKAIPDQPIHTANRSVRHQPRRSKKSLWQRGLTWILLSSLLGFLVFGLYIYNNFDQLARQDNTRPWFAGICQLFDCQLPPKVDVLQIKSSNLQIRQHPEFSGALWVDAIIYNRASFNQAFPLLELTFVNPHNQKLTNRFFKPQEYLSDKYAEQSHMPPQTPIHISLEVLEPSGSAVNYTLNFISPQ